MRVLVQHRSRYEFPEPARLGPHLVRLRPASHTRARIESYSLAIEPAHTLKWQQDPYGNHVARVTFPARSETPALELGVELVLDAHPVNPFDFFVDDACRAAPFAYPPALAAGLAPYLARAHRGERLEELLRSLPTGGDAVELVVELNRRVNAAVRYVIREEAGVWKPEETLTQGRASCRDSAVLLVEALRSRGLAARFVSGYLVQLADEGMIPDQPRGVERDVVDLHAWAEVYLPGAGWVGLDATSGLLTGEGHVPLACTPEPIAAAPLDGTSSVGATSVTFSMTLGRVGHEPRPTRPYEDATWEALLAAAERGDARLAEAGLALTLGGEPTFNARERAHLPEWNGEALGTDKWERGLELAHELRRSLVPGAAVLHRMGKHYPGESLPRWALDVIGRADGGVVFGDRAVDAPPADDAQAARFAEALVRRLGVAGFELPAFEDPWRFLQDEAALPLDVDPLDATLEDGEARARLARVLDRGLGAIAGWVVPLERGGDGWVSERWTFRRGRLHLIPGDSPIGLRLPLRALPAVRRPPPELELDTFDGPRDPRRPDDESQLRAARGGQAVAPGPAPPGAPAEPLGPFDVRTALCVEPRGGRVCVFLPPLRAAEHFLELVAEVDAVRAELGVDVLLEGYPPPPSARLRKISVTPDPGVLEVNVPPTASAREYAGLLEQVWDAALHAGLHTEKYLLDGRQQGSGGGHHLTLGGPTPRSSPFLQRTDLLASLLTFVQHHPSLSYLFTGLFVGPTSQAPRVDEARHEALYELEIALDRAFTARGEAAPPWLGDLLFRHLLVDLTGNTHRAEISLDKLHDPATPTGRQGLLELRAFEMPPHWQMAVAQGLLARQLVASFAREPYRAPLARWGQVLHDRFLLPYWLWRDFDDVLQHLEARDVPLPRDAYRPFLELRCPVVGRLEAGDVLVELRNALEPWHVLGEEQTSGGTARFVDSSMERVEVRVEGLVPERHVVLVNGYRLPLRATGRAGEHVAGVRFRAWAPPHALHAHLGIHHPLRLDVVDAWAKRSLGACAYHVWHPEGRSYDTPPLTRFEAAARRAARFTEESPLQWRVEARPADAHPDAPYCVDLRRLPGDRPMPEAEEPEA
ncbi:MAG: transglutaminase family protein [Polyangiaceae bacterium]|nr:transglutaminase family protein [Polyangiaceae bacterium]